MIQELLIISQILLIMLIIFSVILQTPPEEGLKGLASGTNVNSSKQSKITGIKKFTLIIGFLFIANSILLVKTNIRIQKEQSVIFNLEEKI